MNRLHNSIPARSFQLSGAKTWIRISCLGISWVHVDIPFMSKVGNRKIHLSDSAWKRLFMERTHYLSVGPASNRVYFSLPPKWVDTFWSCHARFSPELGSPLLVDEVNHERIKMAKRTSIVATFEGTFHSGPICCRLHLSHQSAPKSLESNW